MTYEIWNIKIKKEHCELRHDNWNLNQWIDLRKEYIQMMLEFVNWKIDQEKSQVQCEERKNERYRKKEK